MHKMPRKKNEQCRGWQVSKRATPSTSPIMRHFGVIGSPPTIPHGVAVEHHLRGTLDYQRGINMIGVRVPRYGNFLRLCTRLRELVQGPPNPVIGRSFAFRTIKTLGDYAYSQSF